ncbi:DUF1552 domain-containing protein [Neorhodopirellula pilleata]|uniref:DUF1552 domain-containing protein n=1 Tax=Neorhodopirellula pilleata TaxID=2714738 RepID=A0A5C5ZJS8_9BACT|nr:DUF1552 domain-containing protein [Neorhodopirellula pilleata]TWT87081.1 hypothetical protein Pla100_59710 [Neorhodopirellula pilleata]
MNHLHFNRRRFLASTSAFIPLPFLESFMAGPAAAAPVAPASAKRMVFLGMGFGVTQSTWYPDTNQVGSEYDLPEGLKPLARHKDSFSIIQNLYHQFSRNGHSGSTFWLTGANQYGVPGKSFHNTVSVDQVAAAEFGLETRFASLQLSGKKLEGPGSGHGTGLSLAWDQRGKPLPAYETPGDAFHRLFSSDNSPLAQQRARMAEQRSVLDTVIADARAVRQRVNNNDSQKLEEYLDSIRDIETRISKEESWLGVPRPQPPEYVSEPKESLEGLEEIRIMYDLMAAALQVDATRVITYRMPADTFIQSIGGTEPAHLISHYSERGGDRKSISQRRDRQHSTMLAEFFDKLKAIREADGSPLFDNTTITFGSNISHLHNLTNCPTLVAGGSAGIKQGRHLVMKDSRTPLCNLWLSLLKANGIKADSFGDSNGIVEELFAS